MYPLPHPVIVQDEELLVSRRFPADAKIDVRVGQRLTPDALLGTVEAHEVAVRVNLAKQLNVAPAEVTRHLEPAVGSRIEQGSPLAKIRRGLRNAVVPSPVTGELLQVDERSGSVLILPIGADELRALVPGDVAAITDHSAVVIRTVGARVTGIVGLGLPASANLLVPPLATDHGARADEIFAAAAHCIVVSPDTLTADSLRNLASVGVAGVITGSLAADHLSAAFGWHQDDSLGPWRSPPASHSIGSNARVPFPIIATEGFGSIPMNSHLVDALRAFDGQPTAIFPETSPVAPYIFPEVIIADAARLDQDARVTEAAVQAGSLVRLTAPGELGREAIVGGTPFRHQFSDGQLLEAIEVRPTDSAQMVVPIANVEIIR